MLRAQEPLAKDVDRRLRRRARRPGRERAVDSGTNSALGGRLVAHTSLEGLHRVLLVTVVAAGAVPIGESRHQCCDTRRTSVWPAGSPDSYEQRWSSGLEQREDGIDRKPLHADLEVQVRPGRETGGADEPDDV